MRKINLLIKTTIFDMVRRYTIIMDFIKYLIQFYSSINNLFIPFVIKRYSLKVFLKNETIHNKVILNIFCNSQSNVMQ